MPTSELCWGEGGPVLLLKASAAVWWGGPHLGARLTKAFEGPVESTSNWRLMRRLCRSLEVALVAACRRWSWQLSGPVRPDNQW